MEQNHTALPIKALEEPTHDPDGDKLMAALRERLRRLPPLEPTPIADQYRPVLAAMQALWVRRVALGATQEEIEGLEAVVSNLRSLARTA